jgi:hypothetical protein
VRHRTRLHLALGVLAGILLARLSQVSLLAPASANIVTHSEATGSPFQGNAPIPRLGSAALRAGFRTSALPIGSSRSNPHRTLSQSTARLSDCAALDLYLPDRLASPRMMSVLAG